ncbi:glycosyltransferase family 4 protein [Legionella bononiensis]|uniref:Glycosyltransferase family 4 protein n=1 Tax=Legionella bononiensis TaxID=2793102 RepID=A0ABS1W8Y9_9GAMM|nr:glycosyltransferase family 1 protein [Legionella bononiensis]MBL7479684.1 glycosyltransferase family 4 protein [Legionella bononiensis]MBL7525804.1 glycosyltransferase family 4 protein [Legionella bononiensis]MBL7561986.1 glycosyltransferase family 4 protein [Legionella bononiensis]
MKRVLIDISSLVNELRHKRPPHGVPRVTLAYLNHYKDSMQVLIRGGKWVFILSQDKSKEIVNLLLAWDPRLFKLIMKLILKGILFSRHTSPDAEYYLLKVDQGGFKNPRYIQALNNKKINIIAVVHDLIPIVNPEYCTAHHTLKFSTGLSTILEHAKGIITVSETTRESLMRYVAKIGVLCPPTLTSTLAPGIPAANHKALPRIKGTYFITVSTIGARKNHLLLLQIWRKMVNRYGDKVPTLVIIGKRSATDEYALAMLDRCEELRDKVIEFSCTDDEMINYLQHARALLFPSFIEGYGLPLIEALSLKVPVIASDLAVFREIAGDIPEYLDPLDGLGWMKCIEQYTQENSAPRNAQLQRMEGFRIPTWQDHFSRVEAFVNTL